MRHIKIALLMAALLMAAGASAQTSLAGRVYYNKNILAGELNSKLDELKKELPKAKAEAVAKMEKEKGRKATQAELEELDKKLEEAMKMAEAMKKGMATAITVTFTDDKKAVLKADMKVDDAVLKAAGVSWIKRKALKAAMAVMPAEKGNYQVKGDMVILTKDGEADTMRLSADGKHLSGFFDKDTKFVLTRTK